MDAATLTGAARAALGPDIPALFSNDQSWSDRLQNASTEEDPLWPLPLWAGYDHWLDSNIADLGNVTTSALAGSITAALFLQRFVPAQTHWVHLDIYCWNDKTRDARPEGGEAPAVRTIVSAIRQFTSETMAI